MSSSSYSHKQHFNCDYNLLWGQEIFLVHYTICPFVAEDEDYNKELANQLKTSFDEEPGLMQSRHAVPFAEMEADIRRRNQRLVNLSE